jgi:hypothetical protein
MRHLRIFDKARTRLFDLPNVLRTEVLASGTLVIELDPTHNDGPDDEDVTRLVIAAGHWAYIQEVRDEPDDASPVAPMTGHAAFMAGRYAEAIKDQLKPTGGFPVPVVPGDPEPDDAPFGPLESRPLSDSERVHKAMSIHCRCDQLRCRVVLNPATATDKRKARWRMFGANSEAPFTGEPLRRCTLPISHDPAVRPHEYVPARWPWGPHNHHPDCPRHPERYNREEGQPESPAAITSQLPAPVVEELADRIMDAPDMLAEIFGRHASQPEAKLVRGYVTAGHQLLAAAGNSGPGFPIAPNGRTMPRINMAARATWKACAAYDPSGAHWCIEAIGHDERKEDGEPSVHQTTLPGGDRIRW